MKSETQTKEILQSVTITFESKEEVSMMLSILTWAEGALRRWFRPSDQYQGMVVLQEIRGHLKDAFERFP